MSLTDWDWVEPAPLAHTVAVEWSRCTPWIEAALDYDGGHYGLADVWADVVAGHAAFWPGKKSVCVTQFWNFPNAKACNYWLAGGDINELLNDMQPVVEAWAKAQGCTEIIIAGRRGWERAMKQHGFEFCWSALRKKL